MGTILSAARTKPRPVVLYLLALVLIILVPAITVSLVLLQRNNQAQEDILQALTNATSQAIVQSVDREVSGMFTTLRVLSTSELLVRGDLEEFHTRAQQALEGTNTYLVALDAKGLQLFNTRRPYGEGIWLTSDPETVKRALASGLPTVSGTFFGRTAQDWVFNVVLPLPREFGGVAALVLTQNTRTLAQALQSRQLPEGWHAALVDRANIVMAATPGTDLQPGTPLPLRDSETATSGDNWSREILGGETVVTAENRSPLSGWRIVAWASANAVERPLDESLNWLAAWSALIAVISGICLLLLARAIAGSVRGLRLDAIRLGRGEVVTARPYPVAELADVSTALADASAERQRAVQEVNFLMRELAHRSKNQMTVIAAMARQTARGADNLAGYVEAFERRIHGLARSTDLLLAHGRQGVLLRDLVLNHLAPFCPPDSARTKVEGPPVRLDAQAAQILGMAVHELSTNAVKYGAFSEDGGALSVTWTLVEDMVVLVWRETVTQPIAVSERTGFGTTVLKSIVGRSLRAEVERIQHENGIEWRFSIPLEAIDPQRKPVTAATETE